VTTFKKARANILLVSLLDGAKRVEFMHTEDALICIVPELDAEVAGLPYTLKLERVLQRSFCLAVVAAIVSITERADAPVFRSATIAVRRHPIWNRRCRPGSARNLIWLWLAER
jgi:hypothetical protein